MLRPERQTFEGRVEEQREVTLPSKGHNPWMREILPQPARLFTGVPLAVFGDRGHRVAAKRHAMHVGTNPFVQVCAPERHNIPPKLRGVAAW